MAKTLGEEQDMSVTAPRGGQVNFPTAYPQKGPSTANAFSSLTDSLSKIAADDKKKKFSMEVGAFIADSKRAIAREPNLAQRSILVNRFNTQGLDLFGAAAQTELKEGITTLGHKTGVRTINGELYEITTDSNDNILNKVPLNQTPEGEEERHTFANVAYLETVAQNWMKTVGLIAETLVKDGDPIPRQYVDEVLTDAKDLYSIIDDSMDAASRAMERVSNIKSIDAVRGKYSRDINNKVWGMFDHFRSSELTDRMLNNNSLNPVVLTSMARQFSVDTMAYLDEQGYFEKMNVDRTKFRKNINEEVDAIGEIYDAVLEGSDARVLQESVRLHLQRQMDTDAFWVNMAKTDPEAYKVFRTASTLDELSRVIASSGAWVSTFGKVSRSMQDAMLLGMGLLGIDHTEILPTLDPTSSKAVDTVVKIAKAIRKSGNPHELQKLNTWLTENRKDMENAAKRGGLNMSVVFEQVQTMVADWKLRAQENNTTLERSADTVKFLRDVLHGDSTPRVLEEEVANIDEQARDIEDRGHAAWVAKAAQTEGQENRLNAAVLGENTPSPGENTPSPEMMVDPPLKNPPSLDDASGILNDLNNIFGSGIPPRRRP